MSTLDTMLQRNKAFAARESAAGALMPSLADQLPKVKAIVIGCADMRVDPAHVLGIESGEAVVMRNIGGRVTPGLGDLLGRIGEVAERIPGGGGEFHVVVLHHTDCGILRLAGDPDMLAPYFEIGKDEVGTKPSPTPARRLSSTLPHSMPPGRCRNSGFFPVSFTTCRRA